jgi:hypothetical protein
VTSMACDHHENEQIEEELAKIPDEMVGAEVVHGPCTITVRADPADTNAQAKLEAVTDALSLVEQKTHLHLDSLRLYLGPNVRCIAYMGEAAADRTYVLFLGDQMTAKTAVALSEKASQIKGGFGSAERGVADQAYDKKRMSTLNPGRWWLGESKYQQRKVSAKMTTVVVHEIGHILHEREQSASFWTHKTTWGDEGRPPSTQASKVSQYATKSKLEYVAEVFTGLVMGIHYPQDVIDVYLQLGGVTVETDQRTRRRAA